MLRVVKGFVYLGFRLIYRGLHGDIIYIYTLIHTYTYIHLGLAYGVDRGERQYFWLRASPGAQRAGCLQAGRFRFTVKFGV